MRTFLNVGMNDEIAEALSKNLAMPGQLGIVIGDLFKAGVWHMA